MKPSIRHPETEIDLREALDWYDDRESGLGLELLEDVERAVEKIERDTERDYFMFADEAKEYGLVDQVIAKRP